MARLRRIFLEMDFNSWIDLPWLKKEIRTWRGNASITLGLLRKSGSQGWAGQGELISHSRQVVLLKVNWMCQSGRSLLRSKAQHPMDFSTLESEYLDWLVGRFVSRLSEIKLETEGRHIDFFLLARSDEERLPVVLLRRRHLSSAGKCCDGLAMSSRCTGAGRW